MTLPIFLAVFFVSFGYAKTEKHIVINEILFGEKDSAKNEFIELYNPTSADIVLDGYKLAKRTKAGNESSLLSDSKFLGTIKAGGYFVIAHPSYKEGIAADTTYSGSSYSIAPDNSVVLYDKEKNIVDLVGYGAASSNEKRAALEVEEGVSIGRIDGDDTDDNSKDFYVLEESSPGNKNEKKKEKTKDKITYVSGVIINEIYPHPKLKEDQEFIELLNMTDDNVDISKWELHDATKTGKYIFPEDANIGSKKYLAIYKKDFKFALNDSGVETIRLLDPDGEEKYKVEYKGSKVGLSYSLDNNKWRWTKFLTPGEENIFNNLPQEKKTTIPKEAYTNMYADFYVKTSDKDGDKTKVTWVFGDGHKSYKNETRHKYAKEGKYTGTLKISDGSEDVLKEFAVQVEDYPERKVRIVAVNANPVGKDTEGESITVENKSKKKINLNGWSVATGSKAKKLSNHPINDDLEVKAGKTGEITRDICALTLNNTKGYVELRYPDGEVADSVKYKKSDKSGVKEGEVYEKVGKKWRWKEMVKSEKVKVEGEQYKNNLQLTTDREQQESENSQQSTDDLQNTILPEDVGKKSEIEIENKLKENLYFENSTLFAAPVVLGVETVRVADNSYHFTPETAFEEHYTITFFHKITTAINSSFNKAINYLI